MSCSSLKLKDYLMSTFILDLHSLFHLKSKALILLSIVMLHILALSDIKCFRNNIQAVLWAMSNSIT